MQTALCLLIQRTALKIKLNQRNEFISWVYYPPEKKTTDKIGFGNIEKKSTSTYLIDLRLIKFEQETDMRI